MCLKENTKLKKKINKDFANSLLVLLVAPNKEPVLKRIENSLKSFQKIVGGLIEIVELDKTTDLICNEEGKILHLEMNRIIPNDIICGTFIIVGQSNGEEVSLTDKQINKWNKYFKLSRDNDIIKYYQENLLNSEVLLNFDLTGIESEIETSRKELADYGTIKK